MAWPVRVDVREGVVQDQWQLDSLAPVCGKHRQAQAQVDLVAGSVAELFVGDRRPRRCVDPQLAALGDVHARVAAAGELAEHRGSLLQNQGAAFLMLLAWRLLRERPDGTPQAKPLPERYQLGLGVL
jgi:hypothetical protein